MSTFDKLSESLNTVFTPHTDSKALTKTESLLPVPTSATESLFEDKEYIQKKIKDVAETSADILEIFANDIKLDPNSRKIEAYSKLVDAMTNNLAELRELNKMMGDVKIMESPQEKPASSVNIFMTGTQLQEMLDSAKSNSEINRIDATFDVMDVNEVECVKCCKDCKDQQGCTRKCDFDCLSCSRK